MKKDNTKFYQAIGSSIQENKDKIKKLEVQNSRLKNKNKKLKQEKENLIKYLEDIIKETDKVRKMHETYSQSEERLTSKYYAYLDILEKVKSGKYE